MVPSRHDATDCVPQEAAPKQLQIHPQHHHQQTTNQTLPSTHNQTLLSSLGSQTLPSSSCTTCDTNHNPTRRPHHQLHPLTPDTSQPTPRNTIPPPNTQPPNIITRQLIKQLGQCALTATQSYAAGVATRTRPHRDTGDGVAVVKTTATPKTSPSPHTHPYTHTIKSNVTVVWRCV